MPTNKGTNSRGKNATPPPLPSHAHQIMEAFLWNKKNVSRQDQNKQREVQSRILSNIHRSTPPSDPQKEEVQPLVPTNSPLSPTCEIHTSKNCCNKKNDRQISINHQHHFYHHLESRPQNRQNANAHYDDIEEDFACCDGGRCHEGSKNLCTIMIWAIFVLFIINWIISHVPINFDTPQSVTPKNSRIIATDIWGGRLETPANSSQVVGGERIGTLREKNLEHQMNV